MSIQQKIIKSNVTLGIGGEGRPDRCQVFVDYKVGAPGTDHTVVFSVQTLLPPGAIVGGPLAAEKNARCQAADLLEKAAKYLRTEDPE